MTAGPGAAVVIGIVASQQASKQGAGPAPDGMDVLVAAVPILGFVLLLVLLDMYERWSRWQERRNKR